MSQKATTLPRSQPTVLALLRCHMVILCLPGESLAGLISKGRVICPQTCSRAELPSALLNLLSQVALMPEWPLYLLRTTRNSKKQRRHNRKQEQQRDLAHSEEARCRVWLNSQLLSGLCRQEGGCWQRRSFHRQGSLSNPWVQFALLLLLLGGLPL